MGGGGKGDKQESKIELPPEVQALATRNLQAAERAGQIGYTPYQGPTVAALNPMQINSMQQNANAMKAFGMQPANVQAAIPKPKTYAGGVQGYDPLALYTQAVKKIDPAQRSKIASFTNASSKGSTGGVLTPAQHKAAAAKVTKAAKSGGGSSGSTGGIPNSMLALLARGTTKRGERLRSGHMYRSKHGGRFRYMNGKFYRV